MAPSKLKIPAKEIMDDIRQGLTSRQLCDKYRLSKKGLWSVFSKLVNARLLGEEELHSHFVSSEASVVRDGVRQWPRASTQGSLLVHDLDDLAEVYRIQDVSLTGLRVVGIKTYVGERKNFLISLAEAGEDPSTFTFEAQCKWTGIEEDGKAPVGGFQITSIGEEDFEELQKLLRSLGCGL
jgi:hypothetical protein